MFTQTDSPLVQPQQPSVKPQQHGSKSPSIDQDFGGK